MVVCMALRLLITGSRTWSDVECIRTAFMQIKDNHGVEVVLVSGACPKGADRLCEVVAAELGWKVELHPADWNRYGKRAGFVRNSVMIDTEPDLVLGFIHNGSKGATMTAKLSIKKGIHTIVHKIQDYPFRTYSTKEYNSPNVLPVEPDDTLF